MKKHITLSEYLKNKFGGKVAKVSIDAGFTCPNRLDGNEGCLFCTDSGAGEFSGNIRKSVSEQINDGIVIMDRKWNNIGYIAYFQNFTNTFADKETLRRLYAEAIGTDKVIGLAIATRPDCLGEEVLDLLAEFNKKTFLWVELGFQTSNENTAMLISRGYDNKIFSDGILDLQKLGIKTVIHVIGGLPGEEKEDFLNTISYINDRKPWGIKFHSIYIQENSPLYEYSSRTEFEPLAMYEYIDWITDALQILNEDTIIHRLTGDPDKRKLVKPMWQKDKLKVLSEIKRVLAEKES